MYTKSVLLLVLATVSASSAFAPMMQLVSQSVPNVRLSPFFFFFLESGHERRVTINLSLS
jgi:hypothetical protein